MLRAAVVVLLLTASATAGIRAQVAVELGSDLLTPPRRVAGAASYLLIRVADGNEARTGQVTRSFHTVERMGERAFLLVQDYQTPSGTHADSSWVRAADLAPLEYRARVGEELQSVRFGRRGAEGYVRSPDTSRTVHHPDAAGAFNVEVWRRARRG